MKRQDLDNLVSQFDDEALSPRQKQVLEKELANNPQAQKLQSQYRRLNEALERFSARSAPGDMDLSFVRQNVLAQAAQESLYPAVTRLQWRRWSAMAAVAAVLVIALVAWQFWPNAATMPAPPLVVNGGDVAQRDLDAELPVMENANQPKIIVTLADLPKPSADMTRAEISAPTLVLCWSGNNEKAAVRTNGKDSGLDEFTKMFF